MTKRLSVALRRSRCQLWTGGLAPAQASLTRKNVFKCRQNSYEKLLASVRVVRIVARVVVSKNLDRRICAGPAASRSVVSLLNGLPAGENSADNAAHRGGNVLMEIVAR